MTRDEFVSKYTEITERALKFIETGRTRGLLSIEEELDQEKVGERDIFEYGMTFVVDGSDAEFIDKVLSNIIKQEKDEDAAILKNIQKEAVLGIQKGYGLRWFYPILNSLTDIAIKDDEVYKRLKD